MRFDSPSCVLSAAFVLLAVTGAACSSSNDAAPPPPREEAGAPPGPEKDGGAAPEASPDAASSTLDLQTAASRRAAAECAFNLRCVPYLAANGETEARCIERLTKEIVGENRSEASFDGAGFDQAATCWKNASCDAAYGSQVQFQCSWPTAVNGLAAGAQCNQSTVCASQFCSGVTDTACGTCKQATTIPAGQSCNLDEGKLCEKGASCDGDSGRGWKCIKSVGLGQACDSSGMSLDGVARCGVGLTCASGTCAKVAADAACQFVLDCDVIAGFACGASDTCVALTYGVLNDACHMTGPNLCKSDFYCNTPAAMGTGSSLDGTCQPRLASGGVCTRRAQCPQGDDCVEGVCKPGAAGLPICK